MAAAEDAVDPPRASPPPASLSKKAVLDAARAAVEASRKARVAGQHREGVTHAQQALRLADSLGHQGLRAAALAVLALNEFRLGDSEAAVAHCQAALPLLRRAKDAAERTQVLCTLVMAHNEMGLYADSLSYATQAIDSARQANDRSLMSWSLNRAGLTYEELGDPQRGQPLMLHALDVAREIRGEEEMFSALNNLCSNLLSSCKHLGTEARLAAIQRAVTYGEEALQLAEQSGNAHREAISLSNLASAFVLLGQFDQAVPYIDRQEVLSTRNGYRVMALMSTMNRAELARYRGDLDEAIRLYLVVLDQAHGTDDRAMLLDLHQGLYEVFKQRGDFESALRHHEAILPLEREELRQRADRQARLLINRIEVENLQAAADRAQSEADLQRQRAAELESENQRLANRAIELGKHAMEDQLTGLANRRRVEYELPQHLESARLRHAPLSIATLDLDHFKQVNDRFGHAVGDDVLRAVAQLLLGNTRSADLLARMGGEEFIIVFVGTPLATAAEICERLRQAVAGHDWARLASGLKVTISIGVCDAVGAAAGPAGSNAGAAPSLRELLERVDALLYAAKRGGRNRVEVG